MANVHILQVDAGIFRMVCHVAVPAGNNQPGLAWQTAILRSGMSKGTTVLPDGDGTLGTISAAEKASIASGALFEVEDRFDLGNDWSSLTGAQKQARIDAEFARLQTDTQNFLQARLQFYGFTR